MIFFSSCTENDQKLNENFYKCVGRQIREVRIERGLNQLQLSDSVGISQHALSLIEDGFATPHHDKILDIQNFLDTVFILENNKTIESYLKGKIEK